MDNQEVRRLFGEAVRKYKENHYQEALGLLDKLALLHPNSRYVNEYRAKVQAALQKAQDSMGLSGHSDNHTSDSIVEEETPSERPEPTRSPTSDGGASVVNQALPDNPDFPSALSIKSKISLSNDSCSVFGHVVRGGFQVGDNVHVISPIGEHLQVPLMSIGVAGSPAARVQMGSEAKLVLRVNSAEIIEGSLLYGKEAQGEQTPEDQGNTQPGAAGPKSGKPATLKTILRLKQKGEYYEAESHLQEYLKTEPQSVKAKQILADIYIARRSPLYNLDKGLDLIRQIYTSGTTEDPKIAFLLAKALAEHGEPESGVQVLERMYDSLRGENALRNCEHFIRAFREKYKMGNVWEVQDAMGVTCFETKSFSALVDALQKGAIPRDGVYRKNRVGKWRSLESELRESRSRTTSPFDMGKLKTTNWILILFVVVTFLVIGLLFFFQMEILLHGFSNW